MLLACHLATVTQHNTAAFHTQQKHGVVRLRAHRISDTGRLAPDVSTRSAFASREPAVTRELNPCRGC